MKIAYLSIVLTFFLSCIKCAWSDNYKCTGIESGFKIGDNVTVCIHFYERQYRMGFNVTVDDYSVLSIGGAYNFVASDSPLQQSFLFQFGNNITVYPSLYYDRTDKFIIPVINVVIKLDKGAVQDVVWDNGCYSCLTASDCYTNNVTDIIYNNSTYQYKNCKQALCDTTQTTVFQCDPKFYVTWFGTDANGNQLKSSNLAMSRFRDYAIGSLYDSAKSAFNSSLTTLESTYNQVKNKTQEVINQMGG